MTPPTCGYSKASLNNSELLLFLKNMAHQEHQMSCPSAEIMLKKFVDFWLKFIGYWDLILLKRIITNYQ